jgi:hypothetical protein
MTLKSNTKETTTARGCGFLGLLFLISSLVSSLLLSDLIYFLPL